MLFKNTSRLVDFAKIASTVNFRNVSPTIRLVEEQHIIPAIGEELYGILDTAYNAAATEDTLEAKLAALLEKVRNVIGPLVCYYYTPKAEVILNDSGAQRMENGTNKTAYQNQVVNFREQNLRESEIAEEKLFQFLEKNKTDYPTWLTSEAFKDYRKLFIKSGTEFQKLFPSHSPCRNYMAMRPRMVDVEEATIKKLLGAELFTALKETDQDPAGEFTAVEKDLVFMIKKAAAYLTVASAIPFLNVRMDTNGITVQASGVRAQNDNVASRGAAGDSALSSLITACEKAGQLWVNNIAEWKEENITAPQEETQPVFETGNIERKGSFGMF